MPRGRTPCVQIAVLPFLKPVNYLASVIGYAVFTVCVFVVIGSCDGLLPLALEAELKACNHCKSSVCDFQKMRQIITTAPGLY